MKRMLAMVKLSCGRFHCDRRHSLIFVGVLLMLAMQLIWVNIAIVIADTLPPDSPNLTQNDLVRMQWWLIAGLLGFGLLISQGFVLYVVSGVKADIHRLFELHDDALTRESHGLIDHSQLCPICRNAKVVVK